MNRPIMLSVNPEVQSGRVCFAGTRVPVSALWEFFKSGASERTAGIEYPAIHTHEIATAYRLFRELQK